MGAPLHCYASAGQGWIYGKLGYDWARVMLQCHGWGSKPPWTASHIHIIYVQSVLAPWYAVNGHMAPPLHWYVCAGQGWIFGKLGWGWAQMMLQRHCWGSKPPWAASHIHIIFIQSVLAPWYAVDEHIRCTVTLLHLCKLGVDFRKIGVGLSRSDVVMSWLRLQTPVDCIPHPYHMYTKCFSTLICCE